MAKIGGMDYQGGWFIPEEHVDEEIMTAAGWEKTTWDHGNGSVVDGFWRREIAVSVVTARKRWEVWSDSGGTEVFAWDKYDDAKDAGRPSGRTHALVMVKGLEEAGPFVLTLRGMSAMAFEGTRSQNGALTLFANTVLKAANAASDAAAKKDGGRGGKRWPYRAFWLPVGADRDAKGKPEFTEVGKGKDTSYLVLPVPLGLPDKADGVDLGKFYVGAELLGEVNELWTEAEESWTHAWDTISEEDRTIGTSQSTDDADEDDAPAVDEEALESLGL
jgi:hypothetical protein